VDISQPEFLRFTCPTNDQLLAIFRISIRGRTGFVRKNSRKPNLEDAKFKQIKAVLKDPSIKVVDIEKQNGVCRETIFNAAEPVKPEQSVI
jgi:hypothetical protein